MSEDFAAHDQTGEDLFGGFQAISPSVAVSERAIDRVGRLLLEQALLEQTRVIVPLATLENRAGTRDSRLWSLCTVAVSLCALFLGLVWMNHRLQPDASSSPGPIPLVMRDPAKPPIHLTEKPIGWPFTLPSEPKAAAQPDPEATALPDSYATAQRESKSTQKTFSAMAFIVPFIHTGVAESAPIMVANGGDVPLELGSQHSVAETKKKLHIWDWSKSTTSRILPGVEYWGADSAITPDGRKLLLDYNQIIDLETGESTPIDLGPPSLVTLKGTYSLLNHLRFSPDGTRLAMMVTDFVKDQPGLIKQEFMRIVEFPSGKRLSEIPLGEKYNLRIGFSADGKRVASGDTAQQVSLRETDTGKVIRSFLPKLSSQLIGIAVSPDGKYLAASDHKPGDLYIWETTQGNLLYTIQAKDLSPIKSVPKISEDSRFPAGRNLLTKPLRLNPAETLSNSSGALRFSPDGQYLADGRWGKTFVIETTSGSIVATLEEDSPSHFQWSEDGTRLTAIGTVSARIPQRAGEPLDNSYPTIHRWDWRTGTLEKISKD